MLQHGDKDSTLVDERLLRLQKLETESWCSPVIDNSGCIVSMQKLVRPTRKGGAKRITCPYCRKDTAVQQGKADRLPKNLSLLI